MSRRLRAAVDPLACRGRGLASQGRKVVSIRIRLGLKRHAGDLAKASLQGQGTLLQMDCHFQRVAVGGNIQSAYQSGLPVPRLRISAYILCGLFSALSALCLTGDTASGDPLLGAKMTLGSVAAVVLGGTALSGGRGNPRGSIFGAVILGLIGSVVFFAGVPFEYQNLVQGLIVLTALAGGVTIARQ